MNPDELLARAERLVERCLVRGAEEAECYVESGRSLDAEIEGGRISLTGADLATGVGIRVIVGGRLGFASASGDGVAAVEEAMRVAGQGRKEGYHLPGPSSKPRKVDAWDPELAAAGPEQVVAWAQDLIAAWRQHAPDTAFPGGGASIQVGADAIASSTGAAAADRGTSASLSASLVAKGSVTATAWDMAVGLRHPTRPERVVERIATRLRDLVEPRAAPFTGPCDVVLSPEAVHELLGSFVGNAADGEDGMRGNTRWSQNEGKQVAAEGFTIVDDPLAPGAVGGTGYDGEGLPTRRHPIVDDGVFTGFLFDSWNGHRHGRPSTASAVRGGFSDRPSVGIHHLMLEHTRRLDDLAADVDRGYLVDTLLGAHTANPTTGDFSVTAPNVWVIEDGQVQGACKEIALSGSVPYVLHAVRGLSTEEKTLPHARLPHMLTGGFEAST